MLSHCAVTTMIPVVDLGRARKFYEHVLRLPAPSLHPNGNAIYALTGATVALYQRSSPTTADHTALSFEVNDIHREMESLPEKAAWFKDTEGNILCIHQDTRA